MESQKKRVQAATAKRRPGRPPKSQTPNSEKAKEKPEDVADPIETPTYHFIGYVPAFGKVWELDGMKSGPLEVGELASESSRDGWMDVARPALRIKMAKYGGSGQAGSDIRFSLLAIVQDAQSKLTDELEYLRKDKEKIERLLHGDWQETVMPFDPPLMCGEHVLIRDPLSRLILRFTNRRRPSSSILSTIVTSTLRVLLPEGCSVTQSLCKCRSLT